MILSNDNPDIVDVHNDENDADAINMQSSTPNSPERPDYSYYSPKVSPQFSPGIIRAIMGSTANSPAVSITVSGSTLNLGSTTNTPEVNILSQVGTTESIRYSRELTNSGSLLGSPFHNESPYRRLITNNVLSTYSPAITASPALSATSQNDYSLGIAHISSDLGEFESLLDLADVCELFDKQDEQIADTIKNNADDSPVGITDNSCSEISSPINSDTDSSGLADISLFTQAGSSKKRTNASMSSNTSSDTEESYSTASSDEPARKKSR